MRSTRSSERRIAISVGSNTSTHSTSCASPCARSPLQRRVAARTPRLPVAPSVAGARSPLWWGARASRRAYGRAVIRRPKLPVALGALVALAGALTLAAVPSPAAAAPCEMLARLAQPSALAAAPQIVFQAPPEGSRLRDRVNLGVSTPASAGFTRVEFFLDDQLVA